MATRGIKATTGHFKPVQRICIAWQDKRSPVFRIGGDEFAAISQGSDYDRIEELLDIMDKRNSKMTHV